MPRHPGKPPARTTRDADRRLRQADRLGRVLRVLQLLQGNGRWDVRAIAAELEVSERTVYRDLTVLELAGVPWAYDPAGRCYRLGPDYRFPVLDLSDDELFGQATAATLTRTPGLDVTTGATPATEKLAATGQRAATLLAEARRLLEVLDLKLVDHSRHRDVVRTVQSALLHGRQVRGTYVSPHKPGPAEVTLHPYRLALVKACWYVIARPASEQNPRTYRVTRFRSLRMLDCPSVVPADFDLRAYFGNAWAVYRGEPAYDVELHFSGAAAAVVTETVWHHTQHTTGNADGTVTLTFRVDGLNELVRWVVGWAGDVRVVRPDELRNQVMQLHRLAVAANEGSARGRKRGPP